MKKKIRKDNLFFLAIGIIIAGSISVTAATYFPINDVTYDNTKSGLQSTNVQGAIDELYNTCSSAISFGKYMYYAVNSHDIHIPSSSSVNRFETHTSSTLYRANLDGTNATEISSNTGGIGG